MGQIVDAYFSRVQINIQKIKIAIRIKKVVKQMNEGVNLATGTLHFAFKDQTTVNNFFGLFQQYHSFRLFNGAKK